MYTYMRAFRRSLRVWDCENWDLRVDVTDGHGSAVNLVVAQGNHFITFDENTARVCVCVCVHVHACMCVSECVVAQGNHFITFNENTAGMCVHVCMRACVCV